MNTLKTLQARHIIETEDWQIQALNDDMSADELLALGLSAANLGEMELAQQAADQLTALAKASPDNLNLENASHQLVGLVLFKQGQESEGLEHLHMAVAAAEAGPLPRGAALPLKPAHELAGELLLASGNAAAAAEHFDQSLLRTPNRSLSLRGAARAHRALGHEEVAREHYSALLANWGDNGMPAADEARAFMGD
jgi:tetratricopeptide (TPR) repeat protein